MCFDLVIVMHLLRKSNCFSILISFFFFLKKIGNVNSVKILIKYQLIFTLWHNIKIWVSFAFMQFSSCINFSQPNSLHLGCNYFLDFCVCMCLSSPGNHMLVELALEWIVNFVKNFPVGISEEDLWHKGFRCCKSQQVGLGSFYLFDDD